jgi:hypothetical protein
MKEVEPRSKWVEWHLALVTVGFVLLCCATFINSARLSLLEAELSEANVENVFLGRKIQELKVSVNTRESAMECRVDLAVAGFRIGHSRAYRLYRAGQIESCQQASVYKESEDVFLRTAVVRTSTPQ